MSQIFEHSHILANPMNMQSNDHQALLQEFERLKQSENGWKECAQLLMANQSRNDQTTFLCLQILEHYIKTNYKNADINDQTLIKQFMSTWLQFHMNENKFIGRKAAQLFALVAVKDFPTRWKTFFVDLINTCKWSEANVDFFLKTLLAIDTEVVDREIPHTAEEAAVATFFKDSMRDICVTELVESWYTLLKEYSNRHPLITCQTLEVIGAYISWIDINLIVTQRFIDFLNFSFTQIDLREATCACIEEIVNKGMEPLAKLKLIEYLWTSIIGTNADRIAQDKDCDYLLKFGKMLNAIGTNLTEGWHKTNKKDPNTGLMLFNAIESKLTYVLCILSHSDDDISDSVSDYCQNYITLLKHYKTHTAVQRKNIEDVLRIIIEKTKYDSSYNFDIEGEDEAMFLDYRKDIKSVFDSVAQLDNDLVLNAVKVLVLETTANWNTKQFYDIENALYLMHSIGEAIPATQGNHFAARNSKSEALCEMMQSIVVSNIVFHEHRIVKLQYFENLVRYDRFFTHFSNLIATAIDHFIGPNGLHHTDIKVRSRVTYLFSRFIKDLRHLFNDYVEKILNSIQDLLIIWDPSLTINALNNKLMFSDDQLFLYETISVLIVTSNLQVNIKSQLMKSLLTPIINSFPNLMHQYCANNNENEKLILAKCMNNVMAVASRTSKGFSNAIKLKDCDCVDVFLQVLRTFVPAFSIQTHKSLIHSGVRQYLHRMVVCLDNEILEYLPIAVENLLNNSEPKDIHDFMPLIIQIICKYKQQIVGFMRQVFMQIITNIVSVVYTVKPDPNDAQAIQDLNQLHKSYLQFLMAIINTDLMEIVATQEIESIYRVNDTLIHGSTTTNNMEIQKMCFQILGKFITYFVETKSIPNFVEYTMQKIVPCCFSMLFKPDIDINDAQQILVLNEIIKCLHLLYVKFGEDFIKYLEQTYLPTLQLSPRIVENIIQLAKTNNQKNYKQIREMMIMK